MPRCNLCLKNHAIRHCPVFVAWAIDKRREYLLKWNYCLNCMAQTHPRSKCQSKNRCAICKAKHHSMVHIVHPHDNMTSSFEDETLPELKNEEPYPLEYEQPHQFMNTPNHSDVLDIEEVPPTPLELLLMELPSRPPQWETTIPPLIRVTLIHNNNPMWVTFILDETSPTSFLLRSVASIFPHFRI